MDSWHDGEQHGELGEKTAGAVCEHRGGAPAATVENSHPLFSHSPHKGNDSDPTAAYPVVRNQAVTVVGLVCVHDEY